MPKDDSELDERFIVTGTIQLKYIQELEEYRFFMNKYEELTGVNIVHHVKQSLL